jgi:hypothetical protein
MSVDISVSITEDIVDIIATPTVNIVNVTNSASIDPGLYDLSEFTNTSLNPFVRSSNLSSYVPNSRILTINGLAQDLSTDRSWTISTGLTVGTTPISSGTIGRVLFQGTGNVLQQSANLFWDDANLRLGINGAPTSPLEIFYNPTGISNTIGLTLNSGSAGSTLKAIRFTAGTFGELGTFGVHTGSGEFRWATSASYFPTIYSNGAERMRIPITGNVLINTTTDAGFRLDVNGTARVQGNATVQSLLVPTTNLYDIGTLGVRFRDGYFKGILLATEMYAEQFRFAATNYKILNVGGTQIAQWFGTGNLLIQNGGTFTDAGFRLDVNGTARIKGTGTTSASTALTIQNSAGANLLKMVDDRSLLLGVFGSNNYLYFSDNGSGAAIKSDSYSMIFNTRSSGDVFNFTQGGNINTATVIAQLSNLNYSVNVPTIIGTIGTTNTSAQLEVASTTKGFLPPRMTTTQKNAIASPAAGLVIFDVTLNKLCVFTTTWETVTSV